MVEKRISINKQMLQAAHKYRKVMLEEYRQHKLKTKEIASTGPTESAIFDDFAITAEEALDYEVQRFRKSSTFKNALHVVLAGKDFLSGLPKDVLDSLFTGLQKQLEDKEERNPRYSKSDQYMSALKTCVILGKIMGRKKASILTDFAAATGFEAGDGMPADELLRSRLKNYMKTRSSP